MNLKEAFRYQNKLQRLMDEATEILENKQNITKMEYTHLRHKVMPEAEDEITVAVPETEYAEQINEVIELLVFLLYIDVDAETLDEVLKGHCLRYFREPYTYEKID